MVALDSHIGVFYKQRNDWNELNIHEHPSIDRFNTFVLNPTTRCPSIDSILTIANVCKKEKDLTLATQTHVLICYEGLEIQYDIGNSLVSMFVECGDFMKAQQVFEKLVLTNESSWTSLMNGYVRDGQASLAFNLYEKMQDLCIHPSSYTFVTLLNACVGSKVVDKGRYIHMQIIKESFERDIFVGNALVAMYSKLGFMVEAQDAFDMIPNCDIVSWNSLIAAYAEKEEGHEALNCFSWMQRDGLHPNDVTFTCMLKACGSIGAIDKGKQIHDDLISGSLLEKNVILGNALVDMYAKCGMLAKAQEVLENLCLRDTISWSTMIAGYAQEGYSHQALRCFEQMQREGLCANEVTFLSLLNACNHAGKLDEAQMHYESMYTKYHITPKLEHHTCMVVIFGCAGRFEKAMSVIKTMSSSDHPSVWLALLSACRKWENVKLGILAFDQIIQLDSGCASAYVLIADIFTSVGMQKDAENVETMRWKYAL